MHIHTTSFLFIPLLMEIYIASMFFFLISWMHGELCGLCAPKRWSMTHPYSDSQTCLGFVFSSANPEYNPFMLYFNSTPSLAYSKLFKWKMAMPSSIKRKQTNIKPHKSINVSLFHKATVWKLCLRLIS